MSIVNKGNAEKRKEKKRQVLYRIAMKNPYAEMLSCDFIEVAKLKHGLVAIQVCPDSGICFSFLIFSASCLFFGRVGLSFVNFSAFQLIHPSRSCLERDAFKL